MCKGYYDTFPNCPHGHMIRTAIVYCQHSVHYEGEKERHLPCERLDDATDTRNQYRAVEYPCPKCECTENEYISEQGRPWKNARERVHSHITAGVLGLVYGGDVGKITEAEARLERLRTVANGEVRAREYAAKLEQELAGEGQVFKDRARKLAERVRKDLEEIDIARLRDDAVQLAQRLRRNVQATDEGAIDTWEHMEFCLEKEAASHGAKTKRLRVFPDERERIEAEETDKPEQYRIPKVELIFNWDHSQQGRPPSKKSRSARLAFPKDTNPIHELSRLADHMQFDVPAARQAYEARKIWNQSGKRKRDTEASDEEDDGNDEAPVPKAAPAPQAGIDPPAKRRSQTKRSGQIATPARVGRHSTALESPSSSYIEDTHAAQDTGLEAAYLSPPGRSESHQSITGVGPPSFGASPDALALYSFDGMAPAEAAALRGDTNLPPPMFLGPSFASSPAPLASSTGDSSGTGSLDDIPLDPAIDSLLSPASWPSFGDAGIFGFSPGFAAFGETADEQGTLQPQASAQVGRTRTDPSTYHAGRGSPFQGLGQLQTAHAWSMPNTSQANRQQTAVQANPRIEHIRGESRMSGRMPHSHPIPRSTEFPTFGANEGISPSTYLQPGPPQTGSPNYPTVHPSSTLPTNSNRPSANLSTLFPYLIDTFPDLPTTYDLNYTMPPTSFPTSHVRAQAPSSARIPPHSSCPPTVSSHRLTLASAFTTASPAQGITTAYPTLCFPGSLDPGGSSYSSANADRPATLRSVQESASAEGMGYELAAGVEGDELLGWMAIGSAEEGEESRVLGRDGRRAGS